MFSLVILKRLILKTTQDGRSLSLSCADTQRNSINCDLEEKEWYS